AAQSELAGDVSWRFPANFAEVFALHLEVIDEEGECLARNDYFFSRAPEPILAPLLAAPPAEVAAERGERLTLRNPGRAPVLFLSLSAPDDPDARFSDSWFLLPGGASREISLHADGPIRVEGWNTAPLVIPAPGA